MTLRCPCPVALVGAVLAVGFSLGLQPAPTHAASVNPNASTSPVTADYRLINVGSSLPVPDASSQAPQVVALVTPTGGIVPPTLADGTQGTPLTVLPDSSGFDSSQLVVALEGHDVRRRAAPADVRAGVLRPGPSDRRGAPFCPQHRQLPGQQSPGAPVADPRHRHHGRSSGVGPGRCGRWRRNRGHQWGTPRDPRAALGGPLVGRPGGGRRPAALAAAIAAGLSESRRRDPDDLDSVRRHPLELATKPGTQAEAASRQ